MKILPDKPKFSPEEILVNKAQADMLTRRTAIVVAFVSVFYFFIKLLFL